MENIMLPKNFSEMLKKYIEHPCFDGDYIIPSNPYKRPLKKNEINSIDFSVPVSARNIFSNKNLIINKILLAIYEQDLLLINSSFKDEKVYDDYKMFYDPSFVALGKYLKPALEYLAFSFLGSEIEVIGSWDQDKLSKYLENVIRKQEMESTEICEAINSSHCPELSAKMLLIQMAPDFLSEASAMARALPGSFGETQSELMKVFIDEYGYGVYKNKHSTLFEKTLDSVGLNRNIHHYYNDYLPTSLMLVNYFHYICSNKSRWFEYLGALYYTEGSIPHFNKQISNVLKKNIKNVNTEYFDEHVHIDKYHRRMVLEKIISPSISDHGEVIIDDILLGFESLRFLQNVADKDFIRQVQFSNLLHKKNHIKNYKIIGQDRFLEEIKGETTIAHLHSDDEFFHVTEGELLFYAHCLDPIHLRKNDKICIPKGRLHSTVVNSERARYRIQSIHLNTVQYD